jgi:hypothetical protein
MTIKVGYIRSGKLTITFLREVSILSLGITERKFILIL